MNFPPLTPLSVPRPPPTVWTPALGAFFTDLRSNTYLPYPKDRANFGLIRCRNQWAGPCGKSEKERRNCGFAHSWEQLRWFCGARRCGYVPKPCARSKGKDCMFLHDGEMTPQEEVQEWIRARARESEGGDETVGRGRNDFGEAASPGRGLRGGLRGRGMPPGGAASHSPWNRGGSSPPAARKFLHGEERMAGESADGWERDRERDPTRPEIHRSRWEEGLDGGGDMSWRNSPGDAARWSPDVRGVRGPVYGGNTASPLADQVFGRLGERSEGHGGAKGEVEREEEHWAGAGREIRREGETDARMWSPDVKKQNAWMPGHAGKFSDAAPLSGQKSADDASLFDYSSRDDDESTIGKSPSILGKREQRGDGSSCPSRHGAQQGPCEVEPGESPGWSALGTLGPPLQRLGTDNQAPSPTVLLPPPREPDYGMSFPAPANWDGVRALPDEHPPSFCLNFAGGDPLQSLPHLRFDSLPVPLESPMSCELADEQQLQQCASSPRQSVLGGLFQRSSSKSSADAPESVQLGAASSQGRPRDDSRLLGGVCAAPSRTGIVKRPRVRSPPSFKNGSRSAVTPEALASYGKHANHFVDSGAEDRGGKNELSRGKAEGRFGLAHCDRVLPEPKGNLLAKFCDEEATNGRPRSVSTAEIGANVENVDRDLSSKAAPPLRASLAVSPVAEIEKVPSQRCLNSKARDGTKMSSSDIEEAVLAIMTNSSLLMKTTVQHVHERGGRNVEDFLPCTSDDPLLAQLLGEGS